MSIKEKQDRLPTLYWFPKLHKRPYKARFIANSCSCTTTVLFKLLTSCFTAVKKHWIRYYDTVYERNGINYFCACLVLSVSSSSWCLGRAAVCDCCTPWIFLLPFFYYCGEKLTLYDVKIADAIFTLHHEM